MLNTTQKELDFIVHTETDIHEDRIIEQSWIIEKLRERGL